jgi:hypothetical protein
VTTEILSRAEENGSDKETLYMLGGMVLLLFGAGMLLSNRKVRRYLSQLDLGNIASAALPDVKRYLRLRSM